MTASQPVKSYKGMAVTSWILIVLTALLSIVPVFGFGAWLLAFIVIPITLILSIVILTRGGKAQGIFLLITSVLLLPIFIICAPLVSTVVLGASISARDPMPIGQEPTATLPATKSLAAHPKGSVITNGPAVIPETTASVPASSPPPANADTPIPSPTAGE